MMAKYTGNEVTGTSGADEQVTTNNLSEKLDDDMPIESFKHKRGFAAMDPEKRREVASKGGKISRGGGRRRKIQNIPADESDSVRKNKRGFASMDPEKRRLIAAVGGRTSHGGGRPKKKIPR